MKKNKKISQKDPGHGVSMFVEPTFSPRARPEVAPSAPESRPSAPKSLPERARKCLSFYI